ncbi:hypothetical protein [Paractinoplanes atraurantiacus]|uniref:Uncharacterized protein n=1 Tax=Paractinoplanes atraurantiacus TaxID=1036182 RepID=A0A285H3Y7_9ACTN|nr:hypothetical protein [Actinoplanes atraurantiacus]SNY30294.1 hypothetical protein SAMN05421748_103379 [Actinoplanes atraurantiacus]
MSDEQLDRLVRDADPYRADHLDGAEQALLEEIMSEPVRKTSRWRGLATAVAAAAAVTGVLVASAVIRDRPETGQAAPAVTESAPALLQFAASEKFPRLLIDEPGWKATHVYGFAGKDGTIAFEDKTGRAFEMNWYAGEHYDGYYKDRLEVSPPEATVVDGWKGARFTYSATRYAIMLEPRDGVFVELGTSSGDWNRTSFDQVVAHIKRVDVDTFLKALPPEVVTPDREDEAAKKVLADMPLPPHFDVATLKGFGANDSYQFGAKVTGHIACAWIAEWKRAKAAGDKTAQQKATDALRGSHQWKTLNDMNAEGDYPEALWEYADRTVAGNPPTTEELNQGLGCS